MALRTATSGGATGYGSDNDAAAAVVVAVDVSSAWGYMTPLYLGWRLYWANRMPIMDCDEVFNYWEPLHFLLYGTGFQTWEYSSDFALRTYAYLMPLRGIALLYQRLIPYLPLWLWPLLTTDQTVLATTSIVTDTLASVPTDGKVALMVLLRSTLAVAMACAEISFCKAMVQAYHPSDRIRGIVSSLVTGGLLLSSAGMSHAAGALLPSSSLTFLWLLAAAAYFRRQHWWFATLAITATLSIGWPFGVLMFVPLGIGVLLREKHRLLLFLLQVSILAIAIQGTVMLIDREQYGKWVSPTWNILIYNTQAGGDELYGIEPWSYYVKNLTLNFNYVAAAGIVSFPFVFLLRRDSNAVLTALLPMYIWLGVVFPRPHKEERFLFPIYPSICLGAALLSVTIVDSVWTTLRKATLGLRTALLVQALIWSPAAILSFSRTLALSKYYTAPLHIYSQFYHHPDVADSVLCTCGEWYRFPSSFYLPTTAQSFGFVQSSFQGQLPQPFSSTGSKPNDSMHFNDQNRPESSSYTALDECDFLVDLFSSTECRENDFMWKPVALGSFLDSERTTNTLHRTLYIPFLHEREESRGAVEYVDYILYQRQNKGETL